MTSKDRVEERLGPHVGPRTALKPRSTDLKSAARGQWGRLPDVVIEVAGAAGLLAASTDVIAARGRIVLAGLHAEPETFHRLVPLLKEVSIVFPNFTTLTGFEHTLARLADGTLMPYPLITHRVSLDELPDIVHELRRPNTFGKVLISPSATR